MAAARIGERPGETRKLFPETMIANDDMPPMDDRCTSTDGVLPLRRTTVGLLRDNGVLFFSTSVIAYY